MNDAAHPSPADTPPAPAHVTSHAPCIACNYDLIGLPTSARCPECAKPIEHTLATLPITLLGKDGVESVLRGTNILRHNSLISIILIPAMFVGLSWGMRNRVSFPPAGIIGFTILLAAWHLYAINGWWRITTTGKHRGTTPDLNAQGFITRATSILPAAATIYGVFALLDQRLSTTPMLPESVYNGRFVAICILLAAICWLIRNVIGFATIRSLQRPKYRKLDILPLLCSALLPLSMFTWYFALVLVPGLILIYHISSFFVFNTLRRRLMLSLNPPAS